MTYIFLVAGKGTRLHPLTLDYPKTLYRLNDTDTVLQRMVKNIRVVDPESEIVAVTGFMHKKIEESVPDITYIYNPFYDVTNSIASLWFAREYLSRDDVTVINGDIVTSLDMTREMLCAPVTVTSVAYDSSIRKNGDYNIQVRNGNVVVMSKDLTEYDGEYAGITKLNRIGAHDLLHEISNMIEAGQYDQWYENALVQMIFRRNYRIFGIDVANYKWTEVDSIDDMALAKEICQMDDRLDSKEKA